MKVMQTSTIVVLFHTKGSEVGVTNSTTLAGKGGYMQGWLHARVVTCTGGYMQGRLHARVVTCKGCYMQQF